MHSQNISPIVTNTPPIATFNISHHRSNSNSSTSLEVANISSVLDNFIFSPLHDPMTLIPFRLFVYSPTSIQRNLTIVLQTHPTSFPTAHNIHIMLTLRKLQQDPYMVSQMTLFIMAPKRYTLKTALHDPSWFAAMENEISALHQNHIWTLIPRPPHTNAISSKWVYRTKY